MRLRSSCALLVLLLTAPAAADLLNAGDANNLLQLQDVVTAGISNTTDLTFLPDGRMVIIEKGGKIHLRATNGTLSLAGTITVGQNGESGLLGIVAHPDFATNGRLIIYFSHPTNGQTVGYVTLTSGGTLASNTPVKLIDGIDGEWNHVGGGLAIGPDGKLYISVGDAAGNPDDDPTNPSSWDPWSWYPSCLDALNGKILRLNLDGSIPADNPFVGVTTGTVCNNGGGTAPSSTGVANGAIWAWGFRNPWRFGFDPLTGKLWVADVGKNHFEEISQVDKGKHYGWNYREGAHGLPTTSCAGLSPSPGNCVDPIWECAHSDDCASITAGVFTRSCAWPPQFRNKYIFADYTWTNPIEMLTPNADASGVTGGVTILGSFSGASPVSVRLGPDGNLYFVLFDTTSRIVRLSPKTPSNCNADGGLAPEPDLAPPPPDLSASVDGGAPVDMAVPALDLRPRGDLAVPAIDAAPPEPEGTQPGDGVNPVGSNSCRNCHAGDTTDVDGAGQRHRPYDSWSGTMMGNSMRDPLFLAALAVAESDVPGVSGYCIRCHSPQAFVRGHASPPYALDPQDLEGVGCEACHKSTDPKSNSDGTPSGVTGLGAYLGNARLVWDEAGRVYGPRADAISPAHETGLQRFTSSSELCGQCHQVYNPAVNLLDENGQDTGLPFPLDTTYTEWLNSEYSQGARPDTCQSCHMPGATGDVDTARDGPARSGVSLHAFAGANLWGLAAVQLANPAIASERVAAFQQVAAASAALLDSATSIQILSTKSTSAGDVDVEIRVENHAGHRFPTGYADGRRAFVTLELVNAAGQVVATLGDYDGDSATLADADETRVYQATHEEHFGAGNRREWHLSRHNTIARDTRIPPLGFVPDATTPVRGYDYGSGTPLRNYDQATLRIPRARLTALANQAALTVRASVRYQSTVKEYVESLASSGLPAATALDTIWQMTGRAAPRTVAQTTATLTYAAPSGCGCQAADLGSAATGWAWLAGVVALARRRRRISP